MPATIPLLQEGRYSIEQEFPYVENCLLLQAYDTKSETPVTIVEVPVRLPKVATAAQRDALSTSFADQARVLASFKHKSVVAIRSFFTEAGRNYLVTDRVEGVDLSSVLTDQQHSFPVSQVAGWADTLLDALNAMHNCRPALVYRNVRPENIMLRADGNVDLVGSGMICVADYGPAGGGSPLAYSPLEQIWGGLDAASQKVIISKYDESSERVLKQDLDAKSDIYSLGATLYHLLTRVVPVDALERSIEMIDGNADPLNPPNKVDASIPVEVSDVIMKSMEIRREYRFDSAAIMRQVLKTALVRVKEREAEEALVQTVEQHDVRPAVQNAPPPSAKKAGDDAAAAAEKLREIGENRREAERRALEAEKKIHETENAQKARATETFVLADLEDDVLGILSPSAHTSEPPQARAVPAAAPPPAEKKVERVNAPLVESKPVETSASAIEEKVEQVKPAPAAIAVEGFEEVRPPGEETVTARMDVASNAETQAVTPEPEKEEQKTPPPAKAAAAAASFSASDNSDLFTEPKSGSFGLPAIAVAAVVLCVAAIGGWFVLGSKPAPAAAVDTPTASQPAAPAQQDVPAKTAFQPTDAPATETVTSSPTEQPADQPAADELNSQQDQPQKVASAGQPKAKKPAQAPAKAPAQKKAVTVDDLINDN